MLWEHEPQVSVPQLFRVLPNFYRNNAQREKGKQLVNFEYQNVNSLARAITTSLARASSVSPSS